MREPTRSGRRGIAAALTALAGAAVLLPGCSLMLDVMLDQDRCWTRGDAEVCVSGIGVGIYNLFDEDEDDDCGRGRRRR